MADKKQQGPAERNAPGEPEVSNADDGGTSRLSAGYKDNPDKPDPTSVAQIEELKSE